MVRTRRDIASLTVGTVAAAETGEWHPDLDTYARGVELMRALPETDLRSWLWAANTHGIPAGTQPRPAWSQCAHASLFFLPWHRAYLAWFETTIRTLTEVDDWGLPYWDFSDPDNPAARDLPAEFAVPTRTVHGEVVDNPLFAQGRDDQPLDAASIDVVGALGETMFVRNAPRTGFGGVDRDGFFGHVENLPHNFVHGDIGGLMNRTTTAGRDPIFWLHHANIDRLWEVWRGLEGSVPLTDPGGASALLVTQWQSAMFWFGDEANPTTYPMADCEDLTSASMSYQYESITLADALAGAVAAVRPDAGGGLGLDDEEIRWAPVAATFDLDSGEERDVTFHVSPRGLDDPSPTGLILELAGVQATAPHAAYVVEVRSAPDAEPHVVGRFSTFGLEGTPDTERRNYLLDASAVLGDLLDEGWTGGHLSVKVVPDPGRADAEDPDRAIHVRQVTVYTSTP